MNRNKAKIIKTFSALIDILLIFLAYYIAYRIRNTLFVEKYDVMPNFEKYLWVLPIIIPTWIICMYVAKGYEFGSWKNYFSSIFKVLISIALSIVIVTASLYFKGDISHSRLFYGLFSIVASILIILNRTGFRLFIISLSKNKKNHKRVLVVGTQTRAAKFTEYIQQNPELLIHIIGYVRVSGGRAFGNINVLGSLDNLTKILKNNVVDEVVFALPRDYIGQVEPYVMQCEEMGLTVNIVVDLYDLKLSKTQINKIGSLPVVTYHTVSLDEWQLFFKRVLDIIGSIVGLIITAVVFIFVAPAILIESPGPIFFSQKRVGKNGRVFKCYKFRSMYMDAEERKKELLDKNQLKGAIVKIKDDPRITKVGRFIRATSIDELPQFWNVLKGDMSLVGTRPPTLDEVEKYENYHWRRLSIKPGITGLWQVSGRNELNDFDDIVKLDTKYIDNWSIWQDIKLIFKTMQVVITKKGAC
mgnify:FL=1